jgi:hypothetical protein
MMMEDTTIKKVEELFKKNEESQRTLTDFLKFVDSLPDAPEPAKIPFPYGSDKVKPYGQLLKEMSGLQNIF